MNKTSKTEKELVEELKKMQSDWASMPLFSRKSFPVYEKVRSEAEGGTEYEALSFFGAYRIPEGFIIEFEDGNKVFVPYKSNPKPIPPSLVHGQKPLELI